jgi:hypothetical protein
MINFFAQGNQINYKAKFSISLDASWPLVLILDEFFNQGYNRNNKMTRVLRASDVPAIKRYYI